MGVQSHSAVSSPTDLHLLDRRVWSCRENRTALQLRQPYSSFGLLTLLEILRVYAEAYAEASYAFAMAAVRCSRDQDAFSDGKVLGILQGQLERLLEHCDELPVTSVKIQKLLSWLNQPQVMKEVISPSSLANSLAEIQDRLHDELSTKLFFQLPSNRKELFSEPMKGWESIIEQFPGSARDVEEMNKCFALSRYTASIFHALQVAEWAAIHLGDLIGVSDPKRGWGATTRRLRELVDGGHDKLPRNLFGRFDLIEQVNREVSTMVFAWRNKIDHAAGRLCILPNEDFTPDVAEHIISSVKVFAGRIARTIKESSLGLDH